jgi:hypothetical protein
LIRTLEEVVDGAKKGVYNGRVMAEKVVDKVSRTLVATGDC